MKTAGGSPYTGAVALESGVPEVSAAYREMSLKTIPETSSAAEKIDSPYFLTDKAVKASSGSVVVRSGHASGVAGGASGDVMVGAGESRVRGGHLRLGAGDGTLLR